MRSLIVTALLTTCLALPAIAADPPPAERRERVQQKIKTWLGVELATHLGLDDKRSQQLSEAVSAHMERKQARRLALKGEMEKLRGLVDGEATDAQIKGQLDVVLRAAGKDDDIQDFVSDTARFLSVTEQAKLALAMPEIVKDMRGMMKDARREMRGKREGGAWRGRAPAQNDR